MSSVKIELHNGTSWSTIVSNYDNTGAGLSNGSNSYTWSGADILQQQRSSNCKIRVTSNQNPDVYIETAPFTVKPRITVVTPAQPWIAESNSNVIEWNAISAPTTNVDIILEDTNSGSGYPVTLAANVLKGSSPYTSTANLPAALTNAAKIKIRDYSFPNLVFGDSGTFKIIGNIIIDPQNNTPNASSNWQAGATDKYITWSHKGNLGDVNIKYKYSGGVYSSPLTPLPFRLQTTHLTGRLYLLPSPIRFM